MTDTVLKLHDINPDGLRIVVDWGAMVVGSSIFVPCINTVEAIQQVKKICVGGMGWEIKAKTVVKTPYLGVRVWRIL
tara:strand:+ start:166 stop:396 length:231 start_codon:yes stop_codon:yes gene_type:complete